MFKVYNQIILNDDIVKLSDFYWTYILPSISIFSLVTNSINIFVFIRLRSQNPIYKYMLINSLTNFVYSFICSFVFLMKCGQFCKQEKTFISRVYEIYLFYYFSNVLDIFNILVEIIIATQRYTIVSNKIIPVKMPIRFILLFLLIFSALYCLPVLIWEEVITKVNSFSQETMSESNKEDLDNKYKILFGVLSSIRCLFFLALLILINLFTLLRFKTQVKQKKMMKNIATNGKSL